MKSSVAGLGFAVITGLLLVGCGSGDAHTDTSGDTAGGPVEAVEGADALSSAGDAAGGSTDALGALEEAGAVCDPGEDPGDSECVLDGIEFVYAAGGWEAERNDRQAACDLGYINDEYMVLTDGMWSIYTDYDEQSDALREILAAQGVQADVAAYCG